MSPSFWSNTIWYVLLGASSVVTMIFALKQSGNRKFTVAFALAIFGLALLIESVLGIMLNAYVYYPKIVRDRFQDAVLGNIFSQTSVAATSALTLAYGLSAGWYVIIAAIYFFIDILFSKLGVYEHHWYKSIYTFLGFIILLWLVRIWHGKFLSSRRPLLYYLTLFLSTFSAALETIILPLKLTKTQIFQIRFYNDMSKNHTTTAIFYLMILITILILIHRLRLHRTWTAACFVFLFLIQYVLYRSGIIYFKEGWFTAATITDLFGVYLWIVLSDRFLRQRPAAPDRPEI